ncbi:deoxynucleoside triphosphate triphosphohydrolase SAMHD1-like isoform X2 [Physella acuta]|uniref:deoxynucleoside triphosphate triphosphohydrolase SAMHD1-like isoform X2 n=1 Tax=Physella acuta TaxID=109671 RepID=UPI0027DCFC3B|nr:deoxynucleoside triphosphate triphosphohydrolase SAMHD1-like isoform X2 [Physella acuta]
MEAFAQLTDHVLFRIKYFKLEESDEGTDKHREITKAKQILDNIFNRKLFKCVYESPPCTPKIAKQFKDQQDKIHTRKMCKEILDKIREELQECQPNIEDKQDNDDIYAEISYIDFGMKEENPVTRLKVYTKEKPNEAKELSKDEKYKDAASKTQKI